MIRKVINIALAAIVLWGFTPMKPFNMLIPDKSFDMVITGQSLGEPAPPFMVVSGELIIPDSILNSYDRLYTDEFGLSKTSLYGDKSIYELDVMTEIYVNGYVIKAVQYPLGGYAPIFHVTQWKIKKYIPILFSLDGTCAYIYIFLSITVPTYFFILLVLWAIKKIWCKKH